MRNYDPPSIDVDDRLIEPLTHREAEILSLFAAGLSNREIAESLTLALSTVKWYARTIYAKLGVNSRSEAVERARALELIEGDRYQSNLPAPTTPFVGRLDELRAIKRLLRDPDCRLLSLVSMGGMGKTRLAIKVTEELLAERQTRQRDGAFFVPLASIRAMEDIPSAIADALHFDFYARETSAREQLIDYLRRKRLLLILDNLEHLIDEDSATMLSELIETAPGVNLLVTSRESLNLPGEYVYHLGGLQTPESSRNNIDCQNHQELISHSSIELFLQTAQRVQPGFEPSYEDLQAIVRICQLVKGMPLGIELAAAWVAALPPADILLEIENDLDFLETSMRAVPERQRSMRAVFDTSYRLLTVQERKALGRLSVFRGGFTREAGRDVANTSLKTILALLNKSWLQTEPDGRYHFHPLVQVFAAETSPQEIESVLQRHSEYYCAYIYDRRKDLHGHRQVEAIAEMKSEIGNLQAAWEWAVEGSRLDLIDLAVDGLCTYNDIRGRFEDGVRACSAASVSLENTLQDDLPQDRSCLLPKIQAWSSYFSRDFQVQADLLKRAQALMDRAGLSDRECQVTQAWLWYLQGQHISWQDRSQAREYFERSLDLYRDLGDERGQAHVMKSLGWVTWATGAIDQSQRYLKASLAIQREIGDQRGAAASLNLLGVLAKDQGRFEQAESLQREGLALLEEIGARFEIADRLYVLGRTLGTRGKFLDALEMAHQSAQPFEEIGYRGVWLVKPQLAKSYQLLDLGRYD